MLVEFRVENHRSIKTEQALSFESGSGEPLTTMAIYGANASGKSNVLEALRFFRDAVILSQRAWEPDAAIPRAPFAWGRRKPSLFEVTLLLDGVRHRYGAVVDDSVVLEEWLDVWPNGRKQLWFRRERQVFHFGEHLRGENRAISRLTRPNALFLSSATQNDHLQLRPLYFWFSTMRLHSLRRDHQAAEKRAARWLSGGATESADGHNLVQASTRLEQLGRLLKDADIGITRVSSRRQKDGEPELLFQHHGQRADQWLTLEQESGGTRMIVTLAQSLLRAPAASSFVAVDELERSLHPLLVDSIVRQFRPGRGKGPHAQLLFTTHDTNLLGSLVGDPALARDQVWIAEKDTAGTTSLVPLSDYKPRKAENLERGYLQGRYGGIPVLSTGQ